MDKDKAFYFRGDGTSSEVRVLLFNDSINVYDIESNNFIKKYPLKSASTVTSGDDIVIYIDSPKKEYLKISARHDLANNIVKEVAGAKHNVLKKVAGHRLLWFGAIILALIIGLYFLIITLVPYLGGAIISRDTEIKMGNQLKEVMLAEEKISGAVVDSAGTQNLQAFADRITLSVTYPIRVTLIRSDIVNAYALPGGQIVVYSGMLENISEPDQLVALLAHEASHVNRRHSLRSMLRSAADALIISILFNDVSAIAATLIGNTQRLRALDYSRSAEREADEYGMKLMLENNVSVSGMKKLMQILQEKGGVPENVSFLSSHPLTKRRIEAAEDFIRNHPQNTKVDKGLLELFNRLKQ